jgi:SAM-dependent methyltransferase
MSDSILVQQSAAGYGYDAVAAHPAAAAARVVVALLRQRLTFGSVLDVGCGVGLWLREFQAQGVADVMGLDGAWVPSGNLVIPSLLFRVHDLTKSFRLQREFDLVVCLEVAEHLRADAGEVLIDSLVAHGSLILFSAAVPGQGGFLHVNEQPQDYWIERFRRRGFIAYDVLRPALWNHPQVPYYYAQNALVFARDPLPYPTEFIPTPIHPELHRRRTDPRTYPLGPVVRLLPHYARRVWLRLCRRGGNDSA